MVLCCFRGQAPAGKPPPDVGKPGQVTRATGIRKTADGHEEKSSDYYEQKKVQSLVSTLRYQLATAQGPWLARMHACVERVHSAIHSAAHTSLLATSPCGSALVVLASTSTFSPVAVLTPGYVLPSPWLGAVEGPSCGSGPEGGAKGGLAATETDPCNSGGLLLIDTTRSGVEGGRCVASAVKGVGSSDAQPASPFEMLIWQGPPPGPSTPPPPSIGKSPSGPPLPAAQPLLSAPEEWREMLLSLIRELAAATGPYAGGGVPPPPAVRTILVPVRLGLELVGAMLLVEMMPPRSSTVVGHAAVGGGGDVTGELGSSSGVLLEALSTVVAECCLGLHLGEVQRLTAASYDLATAPDVQGLASALSAAVTDTLAAELHVDFTVRLALVPQALSGRGLPPFGFLLTEQGPQPVPAQLQGPSSALLGHELPTRTSLQPGGPRAAAARILSYQAAERLWAPGSAAKQAVSQAGGGQGGVALLEQLSCGIGPLPTAGLPSGAHSFQLPGSGMRRSGPDAPVRSWKARPFSLESTLLASLASKVARAQGPVGPCGLTGGMVSAVGVAYMTHATLTNTNNLYDDLTGTWGGNAPTPPSSVHTRITSQLVGGGLLSTVAGSVLAGPGGASTAGGVFRVFRTGGTVVPHVHAYVNDTDQPSGDVMLLFRTGGASYGAAASISGAGGLSALRSAHIPAAMSGGSVAASGPASLILVMGCVAMSAVDTRAMTAADDEGPMAPRSRTVAFQSLNPGTAVGLWPTGGGAGAAESGGGAGPVGVCVNVALYLTSMERLPSSLLSAARNRALALLEFLLPGAAACLSDSASAELQYLCEAVGGTPPIGTAAATSAGGAPITRAASLSACRVQPRATWGPSTSEEPQCTATGGGGSTSAAAAAVGLHSEAALSVSLRTCAREQGAGTNSSSYLRSGMEPGCDNDGAALAQLLLTRNTQGTVNDSAACALVSGPNALTLTPLTLAPAPATPTATNAAATAAPCGPGWATLTLPVGGSATRDASETCPRVPRSRLSHATVQGAPTGAAAPSGTAPGGPPTPTATTVGNVIMSSYNSIIGALIGTGSVTGRTQVGGVNTGGANVGGADLCATADPVASGSTLVSALSTPPLHRRVSPLTPSHPALTHQSSLPHSSAQASSLQQPNVYASGTLPASASVPRVAALGGVCSALGLTSVHRPPRRHVSELLTSMPWDVSDTLTVMRTNMDILVSSFWNTLRSHNTEASPSPHADEDLRFLQLTKVLGGGGCSVVYSGLLHGLEVAVKVMRPPPEDEEDEDSPAPGAPDSDPAAPPAARAAQLRAIMRGARELAVMTSISHPNIVQMYSYHTRVLVMPEALGEGSGGAGGEGAGSGGGKTGGGKGGGRGEGTGGEDRLPRLVAMAPDNAMGSIGTGPLQTVLIMECCDLGSLADALDSGMFANAIRNAESASWRHGPPRRSHTFSQLPTITSEGNMGPHKGNHPGVNSTAGSIARPATGRSTTGGGGMRAVYLTLLEVALALRHMHALSLVHCDVKPANVLLKSSASDPRGFTCKLTDFGFVNLLQYQQEDADDPGAKPFMRYHEPVGTVTHLAPETMVQGSKLDHSVDIFAFGILMWEVYTGKAPYAEHAVNNFRDVPYRVVREGMRPVFPSSTPTAFKSLAQACWSSDAGRRPSSSMLVAALQRLMDAAAARA